MSLSEIDRRLLEQCLDRSPHAWENFVDRFLGLVIHVVRHVASQRGVTLSPEQRDDLVAEVFLVLVDQNFQVLRRFQRHCSLVTYLAVVARRVIVRRLVSSQMQINAAHPPHATVAGPHWPIANGNGHPSEPSVPATQEMRLADQEQVEQLIARLDSREAQVVRLFHLEGKSYSEISEATGITENSIGPLLSRARQRMRGHDPEH